MSQTYHWINIRIIYDVLTFETPTPTIPAPMRAATIVCVPEIGMPLSEESKVKVKAHT